MPESEFDRAPPEEPLGGPLATFWKLRRRHGAWWTCSPRSEAHPMPWPAPFDPARSPVFARNEILVAAPPPRVFAELLAARWPEYYPNAADVRLHGGAATLGPGARFDWITFGTRQESEVTLFEQDRALGWTAGGAGARAYHRWILEPAPDGTRLLTEECQVGITPRLIRALMNPGLHAAHELWLVRLRERIEREPAPGGARPTGE
jgi:hypothetical protein